MTPPYNTYWGETHDNTYQVARPTPGAIYTALERAAAHLDFYAAAYYTSEAAAFQEGGHLAETAGRHQLVLEGWKSPERLHREWAEVQKATRETNRPGSFIAFPGYEWQGDGSPGDHNVIYAAEGLPIFRVNALPELYQCLRPHKAIAIPHHTAYRPGLRGRDWSVYDETLSPFSEVYSNHGCSETDEEWVGMRQNSHMGPPIGGGAYQNALDRGHHLGAVCGTDNWGEMPGHFGRGRAACLATALTREALWEAFLARRVYGVTGDRIQLDFTVNNAPMGSIICARGPRTIRVRTVGCDALDRIEILRNGRVIATHCHQGTWRLPRPGQTSRFKMRIEAGWGPRPNELAMPDREWSGEIIVDGGRILDSEPCWISPGQGRPVLAGERAHFTFLTPLPRPQSPWQNANVFQFEADPSAKVRVRLNDLEESGAVLDFAAGSREMWFRDECIALLQRVAGIEPGSPEREDIYHHLAYKAKLHRPVPEAAYTADFAIDDDTPIQGEIHYRVRVEQRNGERAWSSPVWVSKEAAVPPPAGGL